MEPLISMTILHPKQSYQGGDLLEGELQVDAVPVGSIQSIETTVLWYTEGKGDEDFGVHFFERRLQEDMVDGDLRELHRFSTILPLSPLSYEGFILKIRWCVRTRVFLQDGRSTLFEEPFQLGSVAPISENTVAEPKAGFSMTDTVRDEAATDTKPSHPPESPLPDSSPKVGADQ